ncbi:MAG: C25 family cysteine peptidase [Candidatus Cloacimonadaceae bacterium]|nr:C25 family cysteine peptidase [Candidatus Cloacimonadaceae bacterium]
MSMFIEEFLGQDERFNGRERFLHKCNINTFKWKKTMKQLMIIATISIIYGSLAAVNLSFDIAPHLWNQKNGSEALPVILEPGAPMLPYYPIRVLLPFGERVESLSIDFSSPELIERNLELDYARHQQPISLPAPDLTVKNPLIWNADQAFPTQDFELLGTQYYRGYQLAIINIYPFKYNPVTRELYASRSAKFNISSIFDSEEAKYQANFLATDAKTLQNLNGFAINLSAAETYRLAPSYRTHAPRSRLIDLSSPKKMIVITDAARAPWFNDYVQWRNGLGISTGVFLTSDIYAEYTGADNAEKVRNFIIDAYQTWNATATVLEYVILGGDDEIVPERGFYGQVGETVDQRMPSDLYYGNLDGSFNANGNNIYGEVSDNPDYLPELHVGRFPAESFTEFSNIFRKTQYYVNNSTFSNNISIMFGENLNWNPLTWGGDYKDDVANHIPDTYHMTRHYERDGTYNGSIVWNAINNGANVMNHMGHANETYLMGQGNNTIQQLQNSEYGFLYSQGCYPAAFDQRTSTDGESIGEHLLIAPGALFAFIGNTRYGWYMPGSINGASQYYDREYFIGLFETLNTQLGDALSFSRMQNVNAAMNSDVMRWCYYEMVLFGDPSIEVKYPDPHLPNLTMESYTFSDVEGDFDGTINPGEIIQLKPRIRNAQGWNTAYNLNVCIAGSPAGVEVLTGCIVIPELAPGTLTDPDEVIIRLQLPQAMPYGTSTLKIQVDAFHPVTGLSTGAKFFYATFDITLIDNRFPWDCINSSKSAPIVYDFNGDGEQDIMYQDVFGEVYYIGPDGEQFGGFNVSAPQNIMRSSAMGDINADGIPDLVFVSRTGKLHATTTTGSVIFTHQNSSQFLFTPVIADITGDGFNEVIAHTLDNKVYAFNRFGTILSGFPADLGSTFQAELAVADLDGNGAFEIIAGTVNGDMIVINGNGAIMSGWPINLGGSVNGAPTVLDNNRIAVGTNSHLYLLAPDGSIVFSKPIPASMASSPVIADINANGNKEIIFVTLGGIVYVVDQNGNDLNGFPVALGINFSSPPLVADIDGDQHMEILLHSYVNSIFALNHDGSTVPGFPFHTSYNGSTPGTLIDFDDDGIWKLVVGYSTGVLMINLRLPVSNRTPWITYRGGLERHGSYASTGYVSNQDQLMIPVQSRLEQNFPNPFNPSTTIRYSISEEGKTSIKIFNIKGQLIRVLADGIKAKGSHAVVWDGTDNNGRAVSSGIYLYRLESGKHRQTKRMLMLK